jgi:hypothetical protein
MASYRSLVGGDLAFTNFSELSLLHAPEGTREVLAQRVWRYEPSPPHIHEREAFEPFANGRCDVDASGRVAFAPFRDRWYVCVREPDGSGVALEREWSCPHRTDEQIDRAMRSLGEPKEYVFDHDPAVSRVRFRPDGRLWVEPFGWTPNGEELARFDELELDGRLRRRVVVEVPGAVPDDQLLIIEDGRFVLLRGFGGSNEEEKGEVVAEVWLLESS